MQWAKWRLRDGPKPVRNEWTPSPDERNDLAGMRKVAAFRL